MTVENIEVQIDNRLWRVQIDRDSWELSTKPYLTDCGRQIQEIGPCQWWEITGENLSDYLEPRDN